MGYVTLEFLGEKYEIPEAAKEFLGYDKVIVKIADTFSAKIVEKKRRDASRGASSWIENAEKDVADYQQAMKAAADRYVDTLIEHGVYDVSWDELVEGIESFDDVRKMTAYSMRQATDGARLVVEAQQAGLQNAYSSAAANIGGSGIMVFTSSVATLVATTVAEGGILMSQARKADKEYRDAADCLSRQALNDIDGVCNRVADETYYPGLAMLMMDFAQRLASAFLREMVLHDAFDFASVEQYNKTKAENMLKNLGRVPNKKDLLTKSFLVCPFSESLYDQVFDKGLMDAGTLATAKYFGFGEAYRDRIEKRCKLNISHPEGFERSLELLMADRGIERFKALEVVYDDTIRETRTELDAVRYAAIDPTRLTVWIEGNLTKNAEKLCHLSDEEIGSAVSSFIEKALPRSLFDRLAELNLLGKLGNDISELGDYDSFHQEAAGRLRNAVFNRISVLHPRVERLLSEYSELEAHRDAQLAELNNKLKELDGRKEKLRRQRESLGIFKLKEKRRINDEITAAADEAVSLRQTYDIETLDGQLEDILAQVTNVDA